ncbi:tRNA (adenosine(37)-N6)-threonylcarbamoyltransferase complex ATPase subunit type 1 TsaE [Arhodomonas aquaeolei]|uniref:tRNA (adenosine(37)-N6)-threonylcarbamoyltransferase complex ATPase subunit type 1 TsaE n=1 Tax=Arhodomonas aquaeolei TaxID=2369 RepID=UPI00037856DD|nr:tRNA (adenosine(37)-N6)-threonylcarbamoyltransferase complex ATPase subunit type 1 TsaE [Arhodomonas aquaeolei]
MSGLTRTLPDAAATEAVGMALAACLPEALTVTLAGDLGAGKTTLARAVLRGLGHTGAVRSPTYTLIEPYECGGRRVFHLDLYRLADPEELEFLGLRDLFERPAVVLVEWPERGAGVLPAPDLRLALDAGGTGRTLTVEACSEAGETALSALRAHLPD